MQKKAFRQRAPLARWMTRTLRKGFGRALWPLTLPANYSFRPNATFRKRLGADLEWADQLPDIKNSVGETDGESVASWLAASTRTLAWQYVYIASVRLVVATFFFAVAYTFNSESIKLFRIVVAISVVYLVSELIELVMKLRKLSDFWRMVDGYNRFSF